ncbi:MAG: transglycosylase domain-containing protein [Acidimicrobiales bacterium]|nr:transglycosylase domain-containing protein [Acidimicrobiales bacterium]
MRRPRRLLAALLALASLAAACSYETKDFDSLFGDDFSIEQLETAQSSRLVDRNGTVITDLRGEQNRTDIEFEDIPPVVYNAVVAIEDERFWDHSGIDLKAILRAARSNVNAGGVSQGGSTITQQYVGNVFLDRSDRTGSRKIEEIFMARRFEQRFTKQFILGRYLNWVYFGNGAYGVEAAAREYFGPPDCARQQTLADADDRDCLKVSELSLVEAATIAGLIQAPGRFNPYDNYQAAKDRRDLVLLRMLANDYITEDEYNRALLEPIELVDDVPLLEEQYPAAHFVDDVKQWFLDNPLFGADREERARLLFEGGLTIHTTIDLELQARAEAAVTEVLPEYAEDGRINPDAAVVTLGTTAQDDGHVLAMVGGRDFFGDGNFAKVNLASGTGRQAGSSMKPIALAAELQRGRSITRIWDAPLRIEIDEPSVCGGLWRVRGGTGGQVTLARATRLSLNSVYAQVVADLGPDTFVDMAEQLGIGEDRLAPVCAAVLGSENVNMLEMATVYSTFSRSGTRVDPVLVTSVVNADGTVLYSHASNPVPVLTPSVAHQISWVLTTAVESGTGRRAQLADGRTAAGKTGTAQDNGDATFVGYTPQRTTAVWVGFPEEVTPMRDYFLGGRVEGGTFPALIFKAVMDQMHDGIEDTPFPTPPPSSTTTTLPVPPETLTVPDWVGQAINTELLVAAEEQFFNLVIAEQETDEFAEGTIISQVPAGGTQVPGLSLNTVTVVVAISPLSAPVPDVTGLVEAQARQTISGNGFGHEVMYQEDPDGETEPGFVWDQDPSGGSPRDDVDTVRLWVQPIPDPSDDGGDDSGDEGDGE